ncbi:hypothetical protein PV733_07320 [Streptomyces europaeiscabiei]|nr:hypothetical protein [Streptomyces europaeiscabiei]
MPITLRATQQGQPDVTRQQLLPHRHTQHSARDLGRTPPAPTAVRHRRRMQKRHRERCAQPLRHLLQRRVTPRPPAPHRRVQMQTHIPSHPDHAFHADLVDGLVTLPLAHRLDVVGRHLDRLPGHRPQLAPIDRLVHTPRRHPQPVRCGTYRQRRHRRILVEHHLLLLLVGNQEGRYDQHLP